MEENRGWDPDAVAPPGEHALDRDLGTRSYSGWWLVLIGLALVGAALYGAAVV